MPVSRRTFVRTGMTGVAAAVTAGWRVGDAVARTSPRRPGGIDRHALVSRHDVVRTASDPLTPLQVGNGQLAFGADVTGLQTFLPFATLSDWGWHSDPLPDGQTPSDFAGQIWDTHGRPVRYDIPDPQHPELSNWLRANPHRINLARIGLRLLRADGTEAVEADLSGCHQRLDLWTGTLHSRFTLEGSPVTVRTSCGPDLDAVAVRIDSPLVADGRLAVFIDFPYANGAEKFSAPFVGVWDRPDAHTTRLRTRGPRHADITHELDDTRYTVGLVWQGGREQPSRADGHPHRYLLRGGGGTRLEATFLFAPRPSPRVPSATAVEAATARAWPAFWRSGGALDLSESADPRWRELERRVVLSQYLLAVNEAGSTPPQESGLVNNGWYGKFHMEMYWWHAAHYALWNRWPQLDRGVGVYERLLDSSRERARLQGYQGARWPKMTDPGGRQSPGEINALLLWQQPHPIFLAELDYRAHPTRATLDKWREVVFATAEFMASYAFEDAGRQVLGPPLHLVSENSDPKVTVNGAFELSYWRFGLRLAQRWRERLGRPADPGWQTVLDGLAPLPVQDGVYVAYEGVRDMWTEYIYDHPSLVGLYGWLPGHDVDATVMRATARKVWDVWAWDAAWGWDFPMLAMNAARMGEPDRAVDFLLHEKFGFDDAGMPLGGSRVATPYFPGAGGLLYAVALMAAGWDGARGDAPGFPSGGRWRVRWEGLARAV
ncbi:hypothetical protein ACH4U7_02260 [Streptomyces sp. NPDC020845]|uniref:hypothetical protein n=1 Tax=Streptomyces sp. NPDC020845 TaxID=3365096 RepID=UPI0037AB0786